MLYRRAVAIDEKSLGPEHPNTSRDLCNLAFLLQATGRLNEAEQLYRRAIVVLEKSFGSDHATVGRVLTALALLLAEQGNWPKAVDLGHRAKPILIAHGRQESSDRTGLSRAVLIRNTKALRFYALAAHRAEPHNAAAREESFELAQWVLQTSASDALSQMSVRLLRPVNAGVFSRR